MWTNNIQNVAVYLPLASVLNTMAHLSSGQGIGSKGSYEMYDLPPNSEFPRDNTLSGPPGIVAPGSPGTAYDYNKQVATLQRELDERKRKETELNSIISSLRSSQSPSNTSFADSQLMNPDASSTSDNIDENVKDAHIKHLQRQVTVLQANLYKAEGWAAKAAAALQERDKALDESSHLTNEVKRLQEEYQTLKQHKEDLAARYQDMKHALQTIQAELDNKKEQGPDTAAVKEETAKLKGEIKSLKETLTRLDHENKNLKDLTFNGNNQALGNVACSRELEYLHKVVDTLKNTVLEQRAYLLSMRNPSLKSLSLSGSHIINGTSLLSKDSSTSTGRPWAHSDVFLGTAHQEMFGGPVQAMSAAVLQENAPDPRQLPPRMASSADLGSEGHRGHSPIGKLNSREMLEEGIEVGAVKNAQTLQMEGSEFLLGRPRQEVGAVSRPHIHKNIRDGYVNTISSSEMPQVNILSSQNGDMPLSRPSTSPSMSGVNGFIQMQNSHNMPVQRKTQSEVLTRRIALDVANQDHARSRSEMIRRSPEMLSQDTRQLPQWGACLAGNNSALHFQGMSNPTTGFAQLDPATVNQQMRFVPNVSSTQAQTWDRTTQNMADNNLAANLNTHSSQPPPVYHQVNNYQNGVPRMVNQDMVSGGLKTLPPPPAHRPIASTTPANMYINIQGDPGPSTSTAVSSSAEQDLPRSRLSSDRLCPVCNKDYSHVGMEDFQTHVFECFDDDGPETMKPLQAADRTCPMCSEKFGPHTTQTQYEKHVHSHFEDPGTEFEILQ